MPSKKQKYKIDFSKEVSKEVMNEMMKQQPPLQPRNPYTRSTAYCATELANKPYQHPHIQINMDITGECLYVYDNTTQITHSYTKEISHYRKADGSIVKLYSDLKNKLKDSVREIEQKYYEDEAEGPNLCLKDGTLHFDLSNGIFLDAEDMSVIEDYIPALLTPNEEVICADAVAYWGNGNARNGGRALMMLNTIGKAKS